MPTVKTEEQNKKPKNRKVKDTPSTSTVYGCTCDVIQHNSSRNSVKSKISIISKNATSFNSHLKYLSIALAKLLSGRSIAMRTILYLLCKLYKFHFIPLVFFPTFNFHGTTIYQKHKTMKTFVVNST